MPSITILLFASTALLTIVFAESYYCPGVLNADNTETACCVGGTIPPLTLSSCAGWPVCTGPVTVTTTSEPLSCATLIPVTDSDYSSLVSSASSSLAASGTQYQTTLGYAGAAATSAGAAASSEVSSASAMASSEVSSAGAAASSAASSAGAAATSSAGGSGGSSAASDFKLQVGLIATGLLIGAGAFLL